MTIEKKELIYEGKAKKIYTASEGGHLIQEFKDSLTAFNAKKKGSFEGKGSINLQITSCIFGYLAKQGVSSHFVENIDERNMVVERLQMIPLEVVVRNRAAGSFSQRLGIPEGNPLPEPIVEFYYKKDELNDPLITDDHAVILNAATRPELQELKAKALEINQHLRKMFSEIGIELIDFKLEFGKNANGKIVLGDEISPDSCRLWDVRTQEKLDKDRFRRDLGRVEESYQLVCSKLLQRWGAN